MKRSIFAAVAVLLMATTAQAGQITKLYSSSWWNAWYDASNHDGNPMCVMAAKFAWADGAIGRAHVKWTVRGGAFLQVWKSNWTLPKGSTVSMSVTFIDFDRDAPPQTITANAKTVSERSLISFDIRAEDLVPILGLFGDAEKMTINFPQGNEPQWTAKIDGSRKAASSFAQCIVALGITPYSSIAPTQPAF